MLTFLGAGCGGTDDTQQTTLGEGRTPEDIAQCLVANGWDGLERGFMGGTGQASYGVSAPSDGTPITIRVADIDKAFDSSLSGSFKIDGTDSSVIVDIGGIAITEDERDQVYSCAAEAQPVEGS